MTDQGLLDGMVFCHDHECPMIRVGDNYECVIERVDGHLGGKRVKDILLGFGSSELGSYAEIILYNNPSGVLCGNFSA